MNRNPTLDQLWYGALYIEFRGDDLDGALFDIYRQDVVLRQLQVNEQRARAIVSLRDFPLVYEIIRRHHVKIHILERYGAPFWWRRLKRRKTLLAGPILFVVLVYLLSNLIWQIGISGVTEETQTAIRNAASETGLYVGAFKWSVPPVTTLQEQLLKKVPGLIWAGVESKGTRVDIDAIEKVKGTPDETEEPHNIVADKPGVIRKVLAIRGKVLAQPGQVVHPGDVLISGELAEGAAPVPAEGEVFAETWYTSDVTVALKVSHSGMTGESYHQGYLELGAIGIHLSGWKNPHYQSQNSQSEETDWTFGKWVLPVQWKSVTIYQVQPTALQRSEKRAKSEALQMVTRDVQSKIGETGVILAQTVLHEEVAHGKLYARVWTKAEEDIGEPQTILPETKEGEPDSLSESPLS